MKPRSKFIGLISLIAVVFAAGLLLYPGSMQVRSYTTEGAILSREEAISRAAQYSGYAKSRIEDTRLILRRDLDEQILGVRSETYPADGEFAAADSPVWVFVIPGNIGNNLPFFDAVEHDGLILALDAATGLLAGASSYSSSSEADMKKLADLSSLEDLDGKVDIVPLDVRALAPPLSEEELEELRRFEERKASPDQIPTGD